MVDAVSDLLQFRRHIPLLEQYSKAFPPSDLYLEKVDRECMLGHRRKIEEKWKKKWKVS
jgi:hypothetical protein